MRYQFIDKIKEIRKGTSITTIKGISSSESWAEHHFPNFPLFPGALQIEAMAQAAGALLEISADYKIRTLLLMVEKVKFRKMVHPGITINITAKIIDQQRDYVISDVRIESEDTIMSMGRITSGFLNIHPEAPEQERNRSYYQFLLREAIIQ